MKKIVLSILSVVLLAACASSARGEPANPVVTVMEYSLPTTLDDGSRAVAPFDIKGSVAYCGDASRTYTLKQDVGLLTSVRFDSMGFTTDGVKYCAVTAYISPYGYSIEGDYSNEVVVTLTNGVFTQPVPGKGRLRAK